MKKTRMFFLCGLLFVSGCSLPADWSALNFHNKPKEESKPQEEAKPQEPEKQEPEEKKATVLELFQRAIEPVGQTLYIWGGAWNEEDTGGGIESVTLGVPEAWKQFYDSQDAWYDYSAHPYEIHNGLDCSGYIGWLVYNTLETKNNQESYVTHSPNQLDLLAKRGLGEVTSYDQVKDLLPGDLFNSTDHIYMLVKAFEDGSRLILHASPPGVQFSGTPNGTGELDSEAIAWADYIMSTYFPDYYERYPNVAADASYNYFNQFRFYDSVISGKEKADAANMEDLLNLIFQFQPESENTQSKETAGQTDPIDEEQNWITEEDGQLEETE